MYTYHRPLSLEAPETEAIKQYERSRSSTGSATNNDEGPHKATALDVAGIDEGDGDAAQESVISMQEVARHNLAHDAWVVVDGKVYE